MNTIFVIFMAADNHKEEIRADNPRYVYEKNRLHGQAVLLFCPNKKAATNDGF